MIYTTCRYAPIELIYGFGEEHSFLEPNVQNFSCAESCMHANVCSYTKALIEMILEKDDIKEILLTDCCDSVRRAYDILKESEKCDFVYLLSLPHKNTEREYRRFSLALQDFVEKYSSYKKKNCNYEIALRKCSESKQKIQYPDNTFFRLAGAHGGKFLNETIQSVFNTIPIVDDTCSGNRTICDEVIRNDFYYSYAKALLNQTAPCMRMWFNGERTNVHSKPLGVIYHTIKFCDYYSFDYYNEKRNINGNMIKIETESIPSSNGQLLTRLQAFKEEFHLKNSRKQITNKYVLGIDIGSTSTDFVIMNSSKKIVDSLIIPTQVGKDNWIFDIIKDFLKKAKIQEEDISSIVTTGYGRETTGLDNSTSITEITCHAKGAHYLFPEARTVIDIGGQDSKAIKMDENGKVIQFVMNDKCAAGTGKFLEAEARTLGLSLEEMSEKGLHWKKDITISSMCTVFAESEIISLIANKNTQEDIIHGLNKAIASKTYALVKRINGEEKFILTGGVSQNKGVVKCLEDKFGCKIAVFDKSQLCGAIGACLLALE